MKDCLLKGNEILLFLLLCLLLIPISCTKNEASNLLIDTGQTNLDQVIDPEFIDGKLQFDNEETLKQFILQNNHQLFKSKIKDFSDKGFQSLRPYFDLNDDESIDKYLESKKSKIAKSGLLYSLKNKKMMKLT